MKYIFPIREIQYFIFHRHTLTPIHFDWYHVTIELNKTHNLKQHISSFSHVHLHSKLLYALLCPCIKHFDLIWYDCFCLFLSCRPRQNVWTLRTENLYSLLNIRLIYEWKCCFDNLFLLFNTALPYIIIIQTKVWRCGGKLDNWIFDRITSPPMYSMYTFRNLVQCAIAHASFR